MRERLPVMLVLTLLFGACGFHLRTLDVATSLQSVHVDSNPRNPMEAPLVAALRQAGVEITPSAEQAEVVVELLDSRHERRSVSVSEQARAAEYETVLGVQYRVFDAQGNELLPAQWLERQRVFRVDRDNIVGSSEEQALLEREMRTDLVQQMLRAVGTVAEESAAQPETATEQADDSQGR